MCFICLYIKWCEKCQNMSYAVTWNAVSSIEFDNKQWRRMSVKDVIDEEK